MDSNEHILSTATQALKDKGVSPDKIMATLIAYELVKPIAARVEPNVTNTTFNHPGTIVADALIKVRDAVLAGLK